MTNVAQSKQPADQLCDPSDRYSVQIVAGPHSADPDVTAECAICAPIEKLGREVRPGDWVHARLNKYGHVVNVVRKVAEKDGHLVLSPFVADFPLHDVPIDDEVEIKGFVLTYQQTRAH